MWTLLKDRKTQPVNYRMIIVSTLIFCLAGAHLGTSLWRAFQAFFRHRTGAIAYYINPPRADWTFPLKIIYYVVVTLLSDAFLVYRCYMVWSQRFIIIVLPVLLVVGNGVTGIMAAFLIVRNRVDAALAFEYKLSKWMKAYFALTTAANILATGLIAFRVWHVNRTLTNRRSRFQIWDASAILLESGALYSFTLIALMGTYGARSNAQYIVLDAVTPIIGIAFTTIIIRVGLRLSCDSRQETQESPTAHPFESVSMSFVYPQPDAGLRYSFDSGRSHRSIDDDWDLLDDDIDFGAVADRLSDEAVPASSFWKRGKLSRPPTADRASKRSKASRPTTADKTFPGKPNDADRPMSPMSDSGIQIIATVPAGGIWPPSTPVKPNGS
jgi:hypothetical protein